MEDFETRLFRYIGHRVPVLPHASALINRALKPLYLRRPRAVVQCDVLGRLMELDPAEAVDGNLIFCPRLYDTQEIAFLLGHLREDDDFVDVGAHKGFYSLMASKKIATGRIVAIEADPVTFACLQRNVALNGLNIEAINCGVSDREEILQLNVQVSGNRSGSSFLGSSRVRVPVRCMPLVQIVRSAALSRIACMKLDIEGFEFRVLRHFFDTADRALHPRFIISEFQPDPSITTGNQAELLACCGYREILRTSLNRVFERNC